MSNTRHPQNPSDDGFTLVEVLLALAITAILFGSIFMSLNQAIRSRNAMANLATPYTIGPAILDRIAADVANAYFYDIKNNNVFYGTDAELNGLEADAISLLTTMKTYAAEEYRGKSDLRDSFLNEVGYLMRRGPAGSGYNELWRREDFYVDDYPHAGGDYVLVYEKVRSLRFQYVSRNPETTGGVAGPARKDSDQMIQDGWNSVEEHGVPKAVQVTLTIYAPDDVRTTQEKMAAGEARTYMFKRFISLPQVHLSLQTEQAIANWDGSLSEAVGPVTGQNARNQRNRGTANSTSTTVTGGGNRGAAATAGEGAAAAATAQAAPTRS